VAPLVPIASIASIAVISALASGCYHYSFEMGPAQVPPAAEVAASTPPAAAPAKPTGYVIYRERAATYLNGFVGTGRIDASRYCERPVRAELRVTATDVLLGMITLLIYTPHTLYVTCAS
jgi:hypothetical protein